MKNTSLVRIRFPLDLLTRIDTLATDIRKLIKRRVPRARLVRALLTLALSTALAPELAESVKVDPIRQGREKGRPQPRRAAP